MTIYWGDGTSTSTNPSGGAAQSSGTWSVSWNSFGSGSISVHASEYIAVGDLVHFNIRFNISWTYDSDQIQFSLPYTNGGDQVIVSAIKTDDSSGAIGIVGKIDNGSSWCQTRTYNNDGLTYRSNTSVGQFIVSGTYQK